MNSTLYTLEVRVTVTVVIRINIMIKFLNGGLCCGSVRKKRNS